MAESNPLNTTPEFRDFVAKKLSELLDQSVVHVYCYLIIEIYKKGWIISIYLFYFNDRNLKEKDEAEKKKLENGEQDTGTVSCFKFNFTSLNSCRTVAPWEIQVYGLHGSYSSMYTKNC